MEHFEKKLDHEAEFPDTSIFFQFSFQLAKGDETKKQQTVSSFQLKPGAQMKERQHFSSDYFKQYELFLDSDSLLDEDLFLFDLMAVQNEIWPLAIKYKQIY